jgi:hypothetical protein
MKVKKIDTVAKLMKEGKTATQISKEAGIKLGYTYTLMSKVRAKSGKKLTAVNKPEKETVSIEAHQAVYNEMDRLRRMYKESQTVVHYLENKILTLFKLS